MAPRNNNRNSNEDDTSFQDDLFEQITNDDDDTDTVEDDDDDDISASDEPDTDDDSDSGDDDDASQDDDSDDFDARQRLPEDRQGNLLENGKVVVKAGKERGIFEKLKTKLGKTEQANQILATRLNDVATAGRVLLDKYNKLQEDAGYHTKVGLDDAEKKQAIDIFARMKVDPKGGLKQILTMMHLAGNDLSDIGVNQPLDPVAVAQHVFALQQQSQQKSTAPVDTKADTEKAAMIEARAFVDANPDVLQFENGLVLVGQAKQQFPHLTLGQIWAELKQAAAKKRQQVRKEPPPRTAPRNSPGRQSMDKTKKLDVTPRSHTMSVEQLGAELLRDLKKLEG